MTSRVEQLQNKPVRTKKDFRSDNNNNRPGNRDLKQKKPTMAFLGHSRHAVEKYVIF